MIAFEEELVNRCTFLNDSYYICSIKLKKTEMVAMNYERHLMKVLEVCYPQFTNRGKEELKRYVYLCLI